MKRKNLLVLCALATLPACDGVLDVEPQTFSGTTNYYQTPAHIERAVAGAYAFLQAIYGDVNAWTLMEMRSDNTTFQFNEGDRGTLMRENVDEFLVTPDNNVIDPFWRQTYQAIAQSNTVLDRIEGVEYSDAARKDQAIGEVKFLRALHYFNLVRLFGGVPLVLHEINSPTQAYTPERASVEQVYEQILSDVQDAVAKLPARGTAELGRATKGSATMLLAEVYMTRKDHQAAVDALRSLEGMGYSLLPSYAAVFDPQNKGNAEMIFAVQFDEGIEGEASGFAFSFVPYNGCEFLLGPCQGRPGGWNIPTWDMVRAYEPGDVRKGVSIGFSVKPENRGADVAKEDTIPYIAKYLHPFQAQGRMDENWPLYRYAEALLLLAEALNELGQTGAAYPYLNAVRQRAGLAPLSGLSQAQFREAVWHEQRVELAFENDRWFQLLRMPTERTLAIMAEHAAGIRAFNPRLPPESYNIQPHKLLYPIPIQEVRLNGFQQNPGW